jgi:tripartite-type tricarboxylate transporter receptor subunit TctC
LIYGQDYPRKPIRIVAAQPGGAGDFASRQLAPGLTESLGQQVIVDNRGNISGEVVAKANPDGYTLLADSASFWLSPLIQKMPYDPVADFSPITLVTTAPNVLVVHPGVAANSVKELIAFAKAKPGALNYGSSGTGSSSHLAGELLKSMAGINMVHVPYSGGGPSVIGLLGGQIEVLIPSATAVAPHMKTGKLKPLAVTSAAPSALAPGLPTVAAAGLTGYEAATLIALFAPAKTPTAIINRLNQETARILNRPVVKERFFNNGAEVVGNSPQEFAVKLKSEMTLWGKVIKDAGIKGD